MMDFPGSVPDGSLIASSMNSRTITALVAAVGDLQLQVGPLEINRVRIEPLEGQLLPFPGPSSFGPRIPSTWNFERTFSTSKSHRYGRLVMDGPPRKP